MSAYWKRLEQKFANICKIWWTRNCKPTLVAALIGGTTQMFGKYLYVEVQIAFCVCRHFCSIDSSSTSTSQQISLEIPTGITKLHGNDVAPAWPLSAQLSLLPFLSRIIFGSDAEIPAHAAQQRSAKSNKVAVLHWAEARHTAHTSRQSTANRTDSTIV